MMMVKLTKKGTGGSSLGENKNPDFKQAAKFVYFSIIMQDLDFLFPPSISAFRLISSTIRIML